MRDNMSGENSIRQFVSKLFSSSEEQIINKLKEKIEKLDISSTDRAKIIQSVVQQQITESKKTSQATAETGKKILEAVKTSKAQISEELLVKIEGIIAAQLPLEMDLPRVDRLLQAFENNLRTCSDFSEIENLQQQLTRIGMFIQGNKEVPKSIHLLFLKTCDDFSLRLLNAHKHMQEASTHPLNLTAEGKSHSYRDLKNPSPTSSEAKPYQWEKRLEMAAQVRSLAASCPLKDHIFEEMKQFSSDQAVSLTLIGKKMDAGVRYHRVDSEDVVDNHVVLSQRIVTPAPGTSTDLNPKLRSEMRFNVSLHTRQQMENSLKAMQEKPFIESLSHSLRCEVTIDPDVVVHYEPGQTPASSDAKVAEFREGNAEMGHMLKIELKGIGEILIGNEMQDFDASSTPLAHGSIQSFIAHHTVLVRLYDEVGDSPNKGEQLEKMHKALSVIGLSNILNKGGIEQTRRNQVLQIMDTYVPHLSIPIRLSYESSHMDWQTLQQHILELIPEEGQKFSADHEGQITRAELKEIFQKELKDAPLTEKTPLGKEVIKLKGVAEQMREAGAVGCFAGIHNNPAIVASLLKTGPIAAHERNYAGFPFASSCPEDAVTGGNEAIFVRLATKNSLEEMNNAANPTIKLHHCPYVASYQMIVSLDVLNLPHNRMHSNSFGLANPLAEIHKPESNVAVSGVDVLKSDSPKAFVNKQNHAAKVDNEIMIRTGSLNPSYIRKIVYQDSREAVYAYLKAESCPQDLLDELQQAIQQKGRVSSQIESKIVDFLKSAGLYEEKTEKDWSTGGTKIVVALKDFTYEFSFGTTKLSDLLQDPKENLINELQKNGLIDNNSIYGINIDDFIVKSNSLKEEFF